MIDCTTLVGRMRAICEGTSGLPADMEQAYRELWSKHPPGAPPAPRPRSRGLGDTIAKITRRTGVAWFVERAARIVGLSSCGCEERQALLNELFPYRPDGMSDLDWLELLNQAAAGEGPTRPEGMT